MKKDTKIILVIFSILVVISLIIILSNQKNKNEILDTDSNSNVNNNTESVNKDIIHIGEDAKKELESLKNDKNVIINEKENFKQDKDCKDIKLTDVTFYFKDNESVIVGNLKNNSNEKLQNVTVEVVLLDEQKNNLGSIFIHVYEIEGKTSKMVSGSIDKNYIDANDYIIKY